MSLFNRVDVKVKKMKSPYSKEFVEMMLQGDEDIRNGKGVKIAIEELNKFLKY